MQDKTNITMSKDVAFWIDSVIATDKAKAMGLTSRPDVVMAALRDYLSREFPMSITQPKGQNIIIKDTKNSSFISLDVFPNGKMICSDCKVEDCPHIKRVCTDQKLMKQLKKI